jgi:8-oxo-dGTP pyrophosphatase MutT (NUDIX family)
MNTPATSIAPAATLVLLRDGSAGFEVLLVQRAHELAFHGGEWVFPGGRVDPADGADPNSLEAARRAAVREAREEAGVEVPESELITLSHWTTPEGRPRRFATWFFLAPFEEGEVVVDGGEIHAHRWLSPIDALCAQRDGAIGLPPPTYVTLATLARFGARRAAFAAAHAAEPRVYVPRPRLGSDGVHSLYAGDAAYEGAALDTPGPRHRLLMRPGAYRYLDPGFDDAGV